MVKNLSHFEHPVKYWKKLMNNLLTHVILVSTSRIILLQIHSCRSPRLWKNTSKTAHFKQMILPTNSFLLFFLNLWPNTVCSIRKNIWMVSTTFVGHPGNFQTILECGSNGSQSVRVETESTNITSPGHSSIASPVKYPV